MRCVGQLRPAACCLLGILPPLSACSAPPTPQRIVVEYQQAVQDEDDAALFCLSAGAPGSPELGRDPRERRENFTAWARDRREAYLAGRDRGRVKLDGEAISLVKLFALGRGTFFEFAPLRRLGRDSVQVPLRLRFGYAQLDLSRLSPGTTFYLSGAPAGTVHAIRVPGGPLELTLDVLDGVTVVWTLVRTEGRDGCPGGWAVASAAPVEGSEIAAAVTWVF